MILYEFYAVDKAGNHQRFAVLQERRKNPMRITDRAVLKWGELVFNKAKEIKFIYFIVKFSPDVPLKNETEA